MTVEKTTTDQLTRRKRNKPSRFEATPTWAKMRSIIDRGMKPGEAIQVSLTADELEEYDITRRPIARFVQKYLARRGIPYTVNSFEQDNRTIVQVVNRLPRSSQ